MNDNDARIVFLQSALLLTTTVLGSKAIAVVDDNCLAEFKVYSEKDSFAGQKSEINLSLPMSMLRMWGLEVNLLKRTDFSQSFS
jgi:hypothetical protein